MCETPVSHPQRNTVSMHTSPFGLHLSLVSDLKHPWGGEILGLIYI